MDTSNTQHAVRLVCLAVLGSALAVGFPRSIWITLIVVVAFFLDEVFQYVDARPICWAVLGGVIAYVSMELAYNLRLVGGDRDTLQEFLLHATTFMSIFAPTLILFRFYRIGSREMALIALVSLGGAGLASVFFGYRSTDLRDELWSVYSTRTAGGSIGAVVGAMAVTLHGWLSVGPDDEFSVSQGERT